VHARMNDGKRTTAEREIERTCSSLVRIKNSSRCDSLVMAEATIPQGQVQNASDKAIACSRRLPGGLPAGGQTINSPLLDGNTCAWLLAKGVVYVRENGGFPVRLTVISSQVPEQVAGLTLEKETSGSGLQVTGMALEKFKQGSAKLMLPLRLSPAPATK
jgi:hypothetical protein